MNIIIIEAKADVDPTDAVKHVGQKEIDKADLAIIRYPGSCEVVGCRTVPIEDVNIHIVSAPRGVK